MPGQRVTAREATHSALPPLALGDNRTTCSALKRLRYGGTLVLWSNFERAVEQADQDQPWSQRVIQFKQKSRDIDQETVKVGDEIGLQGRFQQNVGSILGHVLKAQGLDLQFADFRCLGSLYRKTPDVIVMNDNQELNIVGEIKVPWVIAHSLSEAYTQAHAFGDEERLRHILAQPILHMQDLKCGFGFLSTYNETIFLRQQNINGNWEVEYSPVMRSEVSYVKSEGADPLVSPAVSVKQCFFLRCHSRKQPRAVVL